MGLPLIPIGLVCSRLTAADAALPLLPFLVLGNDSIRLSFPPSPALTLCLLPWARLVYNNAWKSLWPWVERLSGRGGATSGRTGPSGTPLAAGDGAVAAQDEAEEEEGQEFSIGRRDGQRLVLGSLFLPGEFSL